MARSDLKGLGALEGPAVSVLWTPLARPPQMIPWLALVALLFLTPNRTGRAWWIWVPLAVILAIDVAAQTILGAVSSEGFYIIASVGRAVAFGVAAVWLTSPYLCSAHRFVAFLKMLLVQVGFGMLAYAAVQDWGDAGAEQVGSMVFIGVFSLIFMAGLNIAGFNCRRRCNLLRYLSWVVVWVTGILVVVMLPFALFASIAQGVDVWLPFGGAILVIVGACLAIAVPFLMFSFLNGFYRDRLWSLFRLAVPAAVPPVPPAASTEAPPAPA